MSKPVVEVQVRAVAAASGGVAVFLGNEEKVFVIYVDQSVGVAIAMFMQGTQRERPLTHDLLANILRALGAKIDRVIVNNLRHGTYFARLVLSAENELNQKKIIEIDARPSDCIAMAIQQSAPIYCGGMAILLHPGRPRSFAATSEIIAHPNPPFARLQCNISM